MAGVGESGVGAGSGKGGRLGVPRRPVPVRALRAAGALRAAPFVQTRSRSANGTSPKPQPAPHTADAYAEFDWASLVGQDKLNRLTNDQLKVIQRCRLGCRAARCSVRTGDALRSAPAPPRQAPQQRGPLRGRSTTTTPGPSRRLALDPHQPRTVPQPQPDSPNRPPTTLHLRPQPLPQRLPQTAPQPPTNRPPTAPQPPPPAPQPPPNRPPTAPQPPGLPAVQQPSPQRQEGGLHRPHHKPCPGKRGVRRGAPARRAGARHGLMGAPVRAGTVPAGAAREVVCIQCKAPERGADMHGVEDGKGWQVAAPRWRRGWLVPGAARLRPPNRAVTAATVAQPASNAVPSRTQRNQAVTT
jgi:hypothetical protein